MIDITEALRYANPPAGKRRYKAEQAAKAQKHKERTEKTADFIRSKHVFSDSEIDVIIEMNELVMGVDGQAESWGGYDKNPIDYIETTLEILDLAKTLFKTT